MNKFALFGFPISHSLSPFIHQAFAKQTHKIFSYESVLTKPGDLKRTLQQFRAQEGTGGNITLPLKSEAFELCDDLTQRAQDALAVNTICWDNNKLCGDNTDGAGFEAYLRHHLHLSLQGKNILLLGAGGATRGIIRPLLNLFPQQIVLVTRSPDKARFFADHPLVKIYDYDTFKKAKERFFMVINATSLSLQQRLPPIEAKWVKSAIVIDLVYLQRQKTIFQQWALKQGAEEAHDGIGILVWQAAFSFQCWHHITPNPTPIIEMLGKMIDYADLLTLG